MISASPPESTRQVVPATSPDHHPYTTATTNRKTAIPPNILASNFMATSASGLALRGLSRGAVGVERIGGDRLRRLPDRGQRLGLPVGIGTAQPGQRIQVGAIVLWADRADLEVHHRVVRPTQLGATADVGALLVGLDGDLEGVVEAGHHIPF